MDLGIAGRTALVLGSTSGIGEAIGTVLAEEGATVAFTGRREARLRALAARWPGSLGVVMDLEDSAAVPRVVGEVQDGLGQIDILVLNAGGPRPGPAAGLTRAELGGAVETLLYQQIEFVEMVLPAMRERRWGRILAVGSTSVQEPLVGLALSNIARAGLAGYLKTLSREVASDGVTVNMVIPGRIATDRVRSFDALRAAEAGIDVEEIRERSESSVPTGRYGAPAEIADVAAFLCSERASYVTGEQVRCDGGLAVGF